LALEKRGTFGVKNEIRKKMEIKLYHKNSEPKRGFNEIKKNKTPANND
jgi:hypothetical protein